MITENELEVLKAHLESTRVGAEDLFMSIHDPVVSRGTRVGVEDLLSVESERLRELLLSDTLRRNGLEGLSGYFDSKGLSSSISAVLRARSEDWISAALRNPPSEAVPALLEAFPERFAELAPYLSGELALPLLRERLESGESFDTFDGDLGWYLNRWDASIEIYQLVFARTQSLDWIYPRGKLNGQLGQFLENKEQIARTLKDADYANDSRVELILGSSRIVPRQLVEQGFGGATLEVARSYRAALQANPHADELYRELLQVEQDASPLPGRPSADLVAELKNLRSASRRRPFSSWRELEELELEALSYEKPYNLKLKALERTKQQEASGELRDPFKVVEIETLIGKIDEFIKYRAVKAHFSLGV